MYTSLKSGMKFGFPVLAAIALSACATSGEGRKVPTYASMLDVDTYRVICQDTSPKEIYVRYNATDTFYREDGSEKTRSEFCRENEVGAVSRRRES